MRKHPFLIGGLLGGITALITAAFSELARMLVGMPGFVYDLFDWLTRHLPGNLLTFFISSMVATISQLKLGPTSSVAKQIEQGIAFVIFIVVGVVFGVILVAAGMRFSKRLVIIGMASGGILGILLFFIQTSSTSTPVDPLLSLVWVFLILVGWGWLLSRLIATLVWPAAGAGVEGRRQFLTLVGVGSFAVLVSATGVTLLSKSTSVPITGNNPSGGSGGEPDAAKIANAATTSGAAQSPSEAILTARPAPAPGTRSELTPTDQFYRVDVNTTIPQVDASTWKLEVTGLVNHPLQLTLEQIRSRQSFSQAITQECISNPIGGDLISTGIYTGVRMKDIMADAGFKPGVKEVFIDAFDGYTESVPMADVMDDRTLLVYALNNQPLPPEHGFPLRLYIPNRFGMKMPKWIIRMTAIDRQADGYWVSRGWDRKAMPPTTSAIDVVATDSYNPQTGIVPIGGIAFAGARGISKVEVRVDEGAWVEAELIKPPLSSLTWVEWRYDWKAQIGQHQFSVRAYDGTGAIQIATPAPPEPMGATGINSKSEFVPEGTKIR